MRLRQTTLGLLGATFLLTACNGAPPPVDRRPMAYRAPESAPAQPIQVTAGASREALVANAQARLAAQGFTIETADPARGIVAATYSGDPMPFVDCGQLRVEGIRGGTQWLPAAAQQLSLLRFPDRPSWTALRQMQLDARAVAQIVPGAGGSTMTARTTYVLTRTVDTLNGAGAVVGTDREIISFESGGVGRFAKGTRCQATGTMEQQFASLIAGGNVAALPLSETVAMAPVPPAAATPSTPAPVADTAYLPPADAGGSRIGLDRSALDQPAPVAETELAAPASAPSFPEPAAGPVGVAGSEAARGAATAAGGASAAGTAAMMAALEARPGADLASRHISLPCAEVDLEQGSGGIVLTGFVGSEADRATLLDGVRQRSGGAPVTDTLALLPPGSCTAVELVRSTAQRGGSGLSIGLQDGATVLHAGDDVVLDVTIPGADRHFYVDYFQKDGTVRHIPPRYIGMTEVGERFIYKTGHEVVEPFGTEMVLAIASREPLFENAPRPIVEPSEVYLEALKASLARDGGSGLMAQKLLLEIEPR